MVPVSAAIKCGHRRILIHTVDTDVLVLAVWVLQELHDMVEELWLAFGTGKNFCYIGVHELVAYVGPEKFKEFLWSQVCN